MVNIYFAGSGLDTLVANGGATENALSSGTAGESTPPGGGIFLGSFVNPGLNTQATVSSVWLNCQLTSFNYFGQTDTETSSGLQIHQYNSTLSNPKPIASVEIDGIYLFTNGSFKKIASHNSNINQNTTIDFNVSGIGTKNGSLSAYLNGTLASSINGVDLSSFLNAGAVSIGPVVYTGNANWLQLIASDTCTIGAYLQQNIASSTATYSEWGGTLSTAVPLNTSAGVYANTTGLRISSKAVAPKNKIDENLYTVAAVIVSAAVSNTATWSNNQTLFRYNGTDYTYNSANNQTGLYPMYTILTQSPDGTPWTVAKATSIEYGLKSGPK